MSDANRPLKVGVTALFDPNDTPHARTFLRAMAAARNSIPALAAVHWLFLDDGADARQAEQVARQFIARKVDVVIGHFSSDAAVPAAPLYRQAGIALLTPAATLDCLTLEHPNVFRFCPADRQLASDLLDWLQRQRWLTVHVEADQSAHGQALAKCIAQAASAAGLRCTTDPQQAQVEVFAGRLHSSREHWQQRRREGSQRPLILTDDALSPYLGHALADDRNTYVIGFGCAQNSTGQGSGVLLHRQLFAAEPETYYHESLLLFHVLGSLASQHLGSAERLQALNHSTFNTPLGEVSFAHGERRGTFNSLWRLGPAGLEQMTD